MKQTFISSYINRMLPSIILSQIVMSICEVIDTALTGLFLGAQAVAAEGMVTPVILIGLAVASIMSAGNSTICSNESGKGNVGEINRVFSTTLAVSLSFSTVVTILVLLFASQVCQSLGLTPNTELFILTKDYMQGYLPILPMIAVIVTLPAVLQIEGDNKTAVAAVLIVFVLDIVFDLLNIFVFHGGVFGMALATTFSYYIAGILVLVRFFGKKRTIKFSLKFVELQRVGKILSYGTPAFVNALCLGLTTAAINAAFLQFGSEIYIAAFTIVMKIGEILVCFAQGIGEMTATVTGIINGEEDRDGLKEILQIMFRKSLTINLVLIVVTCAASSFVVRIFTADAEIIELSAFGLQIFSTQFIFRSLILSYVGYLRGLTKFMAGNVILAVLTICVSVFALKAPLIFGVDAIWYSYSVGVTATLIFIIFYVGYATKKNPFDWENLILKSESYGIAKENYLEWEIDDIEKLLRFRELSAEFVKSHGGNERQSHLYSLFIEELGKNILSWAFRDDKQHRLTIKIMYGADGFKLRFRDDGIQFDPAEYYRIHKGENSTENLGIRMVFGMNPEVTYLNTMNLNNLLVKVK